MILQKIKSLKSNKFAVIKTETKTFSVFFVVFDFVQVLSVNKILNFSSKSKQEFIYIKKNLYFGRIYYSLVTKYNDFFLLQNEPSTVSACMYVKQLVCKLYICICIKKVLVSDRADSIG